MHRESPPVLVGYDGAPAAHDALALGAALAAVGAAPLVLSVAHGAGVDRGEMLAQLALALDLLPPEARSGAELRAVAGSSPGPALQELAQGLRPRALVLGSGRRAPHGRVMAGSVGQRLLNGAPCPVALAPSGLAIRERQELRTVCVGFDARAEGWTALRCAAQLGLPDDVRLRVALVMEPSREAGGDDRLRAARIVLDRAVESVRDRGPAEGRLLIGDPVEQLVAQAADGVDLLVLGSRGYGPLREVATGSVSDALLRAVGCPVMIVPRTAEL